MPPDTTACIFWLKNRKPEWRDRHELVVDDLKEISDESMRAEEWEREYYH